MMQDMKSHAHIKPGRNGTKGLVGKYGDSLICVSYRYDEIRGVRWDREEKLWRVRYGAIIGNADLTDRGQDRMKEVTYIGKPVNNELVKSKIIYYAK